MKSSKRWMRYRPFQDLGDLLDEHAFPLAGEDRHATDATVHDSVEVAGAPIQDEKALFREAMEDVVPMEPPAVLSDGPRSPLSWRAPKDPEGEVVASLNDLVRHGHGFHVSHTSEYMEGVGYGVERGMARRLHRGDFSVQDHIDLHGLLVDEAKTAFDAFLGRSIAEAKRSLLVIHGRGLSSARGPVLKGKVKEWLTSGVWRKWVLAFATARPCDGGAGATYILLRRHPATKRFRKR
jgi:DNA-nicking Smr family endonuclease